MKLARENLRIMLIEDNDTESELLQEVLLDAGFAYPLTKLQNGGVAIEFFTYAKAAGSPMPHIVLLDLNMPLIDGVHALRCLRGAASFSDLPVIVLTGFEDPAKKVELAQMGIFRFLEKVPNYANVITALDDFMRLANRGADFSASREIKPPDPHVKSQRHRF